MTDRNDAPPTDDRARSSCLDETAVQAYLERRLAAEAAERVERHVDGCPDCRALISSLARGRLLGGDTGDAAIDTRARASTLVEPNADATSLTLDARYALQERVARGGMGEIWRAKDLHRDATVAVKRILLALGDAPGDQRHARLLREAAALQQLEHPNIVRCLGAGLEPGGQPYLVLEWLAGEDLASRQRRAPLDLDAALAVIDQALAGLEACHRAGTVHRDVKPGNTFLVADEGAEGDTLRVKLIDFGLALLRDEATRLTRAGSLLGTLQYLSPEQAQGVAEIDHRSDVYAVGVVLYELTTGRLPFVASQPAALLLKIINETPPPPRRLRPDLPPAVAAVIARAMQRRPDQRFPSAAAMRAALQAARRAGDAEVAELTADPLPGAIERRLVSLLCLRAHADDRPTAERLLDRAGGRVQRLLDGQLVALFGLERSEGDEARRAVQAGERIRLAARRREELRSLVATVHLDVDTGATGRGLQLDADDLDRAAATVDALPRGELAVDAKTRELLGQHAVLAPLGAELYAVRALRVGPATRTVFGRQLPIIGREVELAAIDATLARVVDHREPQALLLLGPPGIGKTRLLDELRPELGRRAALYLEARPDSAARATPYSLLADALQRTAEIRLGDDAATHRGALLRLVGAHVAAEAAPETAALIGEVAGIAFPPTAALRVARGDPKVLRQRVAEAFEALLAAAGRGGRLVVLCLEDLHWADEESLRLCERLLDRLEETPLLVLATARPELLERHPALWRAVEARHLEVEPLGRRAMRRLIRGILGEAEREQLEAIAAQSEGNPLFAEELSAWLAGASAAAAPRPALPTTVELALQARLDRLTVELKELLKGAAVFGGGFTATGCAAIGFPRALVDLPRLEAAGFVAAPSDSGGERWSFRHALVREVAYGMLPAAQQEALHLRAGRWLEQAGEPDAARLAEHFARGGDAQRAAHYLARAGERALFDSDPSSAVTLFEQALDVDCADEERARRARGLARAHYLLGDFAAARAALDRFEPRLDGDEHEASGPRRRARAELRLLRGQLLFATAEYREARAALDHAAALLDDDANADADLRFDVGYARFVVCWGEGRYEEVRRHAAALGRAARRDDQRCAAELAQAYAEVVAGDLGAALLLAEEAARRAEAIGHRYRELDALLLLGSANELAGRLDAAAAALDRAAALAARLGSAYHLASIASGQGRLRVLGGAVEDALERYRTAEAHASSSGDQRGEAEALVGAARALCRRGAGADLEQAAALAERALALAGDRAPPVAAEAHLARAEVALARREAEAATREALAAVGLLDRLGAQESTETEILLVAHDALVAAERPDEALAMLRRAHEALAARRRRIGSTELAASFSERVPHNHRVEQLWRARGEGGGER